MHVGDLDDDPVRRREGVAASLESMVSHTVEERGTLTPFVEGDYVRARGTVIDPDDDVQFNFLRSAVLSVKLLNDAASNAGYGINFKTSSFETAVTTAEFGVDWDGDGIFNHLDTDSDNDGIADNVEAQSTAGYIAPGGSGATITDLDNDGLDDNYDADTSSVDVILSVGLALVNTDSAEDGPDITDLDSDADGLPDVFEGIVDTDNDGEPNFRDTDSDGGGVNDGIEAQLTGIDTDEDGIDDLFDVDVTSGVDANGDGIDDNVVLSDSDGNGVSDYLEPASAPLELSLIHI